MLTVGYHVETGLQLQETFVITPSLAYSPVMEDVMRIAKHVMAVVLKDSNLAPLATLTETMSKSATMTLIRVAIIFIMDFVGARINMSLPILIGILFEDIFRQLIIRRIRIKDISRVD